MPTIIQSPTPNLSKSMKFYQKLKFKNISTETQSFVSDGKSFIHINPDKFARAGIKMYRETWNKEIAALSNHCTIHTIENGYLLADPSNCWIYLLEGTAPINTEKGDCFSSLGNFAGLSLETADMDRSFEIYSILGFEKTMGDLDQGWIAFKNEDDFGISLMKPNSCPHLFFNPSMTYFNGGKNLPIIEKIKEAGIELIEEITHFNKEGIVDNVIIRDPGGYGFFIFND